MKDIPPIIDFATNHADKKHTEEGEKKKENTGCTQRSKLR
jgi:hypothetical protein